MSGKFSKDATDRRAQQAGLMQDYHDLARQLERELAQAHAELAAERSEHARLKNTVAFMERQYLASHGGSWGECEYQVRAESAERKLEESTRLLRDYEAQYPHGELGEDARAYLKDKPA